MLRKSCAEFSAASIGRTWYYRYASDIADAQPAMVIVAMSNTHHGERDACRICDELRAEGVVAYPYRFPRSAPDGCDIQWVIAHEGEPVNGSCHACKRITRFACTCSVIGLDDFVLEQCRRPDVTPPRLTIADLLAYVAQHGPISERAIVQALGRSKWQRDNIMGRLGRLERQGHIERTGTDTARGHTYAVYQVKEE